MILIANYNIHIGKSQSFYPWNLEFSLEIAKLIFALTISFYLLYVSKIPSANVSFSIFLSAFF